MRALAAMLVLLVGVVGVGCGSSGSESTGDDEVLVLAAASLTDAFAELEAGFEAANPGIDVQVSFAGSSALREQILQGAPADVFASANEATMEAVATAGGLAGDRTVFATNSLAVAVPAGNPGEVRGLDDLADPSLLIGLCAEGVPCGDAARQLLVAAGVDPAVDTNEPDVRALLTKIAAGELDAGVVYRTDIEADERVEAIPIDDAVNVVVSYPIAELTDAPHPRAAAAFVDYVLSPTGQATLRGFGFGPPDAP